MTEQTRKIETYTFLIALIAVSGFFLFTVKGLLIPVFYGLVFAIVLYPFYSRLNKVLKNKQALAAVITILLAFIALAVLFGSIGGFVAKDALLLLDTVSHKVDALAPRALSLWEGVQGILPQAAVERLSEINLRQQVVGVVSNVAQSIFNSFQALAANFVRLLGFSVVTFYATFYFLRNGIHWLKRLSEILPLPGRDEKYLTNRFIAMVRASLKMVFVMGAVQGFLGGLIFWLLGIGAPFFWGLIFALLSLVPGLGHYAVWIPAAAILALTGEIGKAIILAAYGLLILASSDDVLRPYLVGRSVKIHPFLVFVATIGGIATFGFTGLILGPVAAALTLAFWELFEKRYSQT